MPAVRTLSAKSSTTQNNAFVRLLLLETRRLVANNLSCLVQLLMSVSQDNLVTVELVTQLVEGTNYFHFHSFTN